MEMVKFLVVVILTTDDLATGSESVKASEEAAREYPSQPSTLSFTQILIVIQMDDSGIGGQYSF